MFKKIYILMLIMCSTVFSEWTMQDISGRQTYLETYITKQAVNGEALAVWIEKPNGIYYLKAAFWNGSQWQIDTLYSSVEMMYFVCTEFDENEDPIICWAVTSNQTSIYVSNMSLNGSDCIWTNKLVQENEVSLYDMKLIENHTNHIAVLCWMEIDTNSMYGLKLSTWNGTEWSDVKTVCSGICNSMKLLDAEINSLGDIFIPWISIENGYSHAMTLIWTHEE